MFNLFHEISYLYVINIDSKMKHLTIKAVLKTWVKPDQNKEYGIYLRLTKARKISYVYLGIKCNEKDWDKNSGKVKNSNKNASLLNTIIETKAQEYRKLDLSTSIEEVLTPTELKAKVENKIPMFSIRELLKNKISQLHESGKLGNKAVYKDLLNSLQNFCKLRTPAINFQNLFISNIDYEFLINYESYLFANKNSSAGVSIKMRTLRALYNHAIKLGASKDKYPFEVYKVQQRLKSEPEHIALSAQQIAQIKELNFPIHSTKFEAQQYFLFSYYALGMNLTDIAKLTWSNVVGNKISFIRQKTGKRINIPITDNMKRIIQYFQNDNTTPDDYIFPILNIKLHITATQIEDRIHKVNKRINKNLKEFAIYLGIKVNLHFYIARHTMASTLRRSGQSVTAIKEIMGHEDEKTTQIYLDSMDEDIFLEAANLL